MFKKILKSLEDSRCLPCAGVVGVQSGETAPGLPHVPHHDLLVLGSTDQHGGLAEGPGQGEDGSVRLVAGPSYHSAYILTFTELLA